MQGKQATAASGPESPHINIKKKLIVGEIHQHLNNYQTADFVPIYIGNHVEGVVFKQ